MIDNKNYPYIYNNNDYTKKVKSGSLNYVDVIGFEMIMCLIFQCVNMTHQ